jgi:hypothetical protein
MIKGNGLVLTKIKLMKHLYSLLFMLVALISSNQSMAQNVTTTPASYPGACDGTASFSNYSDYNPANWTWTWYVDSTTVIATGDTMLTNLCTGYYSLSLDSANYSMVQPFTLL